MSLYSYYNSVNVQSFIFLPEIEWNTYFKDNITIYLDFWLNYPIMDGH